MTELSDDGTLIFLPVRLNNQPVIMGGLTADEMWATLAISAGSGLVIGILAAILTHIWALIIATAMLFAILGLTLSSRFFTALETRPIGHLALPPDATERCTISSYLEQGPPDHTHGCVDLP